MKGTAASQLTSRILSRDHQMTARSVVPIAQKVTSAKPSEGRGRPLNSQPSRDIHAARPIPTSKPTSARQGTVCVPSVPCPPQQVEKPTNEKPCIEALLPTAHLPETCGTEGTRTTRIRKGGPPPFKPVSRAQCVISTCDPQDSIPVTVKPVYRKGLLFAYSEYLNSAHMSSEINHPRLSITDLRRSPQALRQKNPEQRARHGPKQIVKGGMTNADVSKPVLHPSSAVAVPPPSSPPASSRDPTSTTPKEEPPVRINIRRQPYIDTAHSRCAQRPTSTTPNTPITWPIHCADLFSPSSHNAYISPKCISNRLKRAPRMLGYRPSLDCPDSPSPCSRVKAKVSQSTIPTITPLSRTICRKSTIPPFQSPPSRSFEMSVPVELTPSTNSQPYIAAEVSAAPMPDWLKDLFERCPPPTFEMCIRNRF